MPRFFFHIHNGISVLDDTGVDLPDVAAAQAAALRLSSDILKNGATGPLWDHLRWRMEVTDNPQLNSGRTFFVVEFSITQ